MGGGISTENSYVDIFEMSVGIWLAKCSKFKRLKYLLDFEDIWLINMWDKENIGNWYKYCWYKIEIDPMYQQDIRLRYCSSNGDDLKNVNIWKLPQFC